MKISVVFEEWSKYINQHVIAHEDLLITGDLNFHLSKSTDHILDVVITRDNSNISQSSPSIDDTLVLFASM
jgi:hypothetical protein